ncbi:MAG: arylsulfatase [Isosphaeraceae bacterium]|nr:arylsulfatase [Isosphaeraceae bacterium]
MRTRWIALVLGLTAVLTASASARDTTTGLAAGTPPNIIVLLADDMGFGDPRCFNPDSKALTPHMDRLAREGRRFIDAHSPSSVCSPTRYALLTGRYAWRSRLKRGVLKPWDPALIEPGRLTLPALLKRHGYATAAFGKWHLGWTWTGLDGKPLAAEENDFPRRVDFTRPILEGPTTRGFDDFFGMVGNTVASPCLLENDRPLFTGASPPLNEPPDIAGVPRALLEPWEERNSLPVLTEKVTWYLDQQGAEAPRRPFFVYFAMTAPHAPLIPYGRFRGLTAHGDECDLVSQLDDTVGRVLDAIERNGLADNTLVLLSSDNGSPGFADEGAPTASVIARYGHHPNGPWRGMKGDAHEGGHRVPLIARWPGRVPPGTTSDETVCLVDLLATCAALVGDRLPEEAGEDSHDILPALLGVPHKTPIREATVHHTLTGMFAIRQGDWKLILGRGSGGFTLPQDVPSKPGEPAGQLYHLKDDPKETNDLYTQRPEIVTRLTTLLETYQRTGRSAPWPPRPQAPSR